MTHFFYSAFKAKQAPDTEHLQCEVILCGEPVLMEYTDVITCKDKESDNVIRLFNDLNCVYLGSHETPVIDPNIYGTSNAFKRFFNGF